MDGLNQSQLEILDVWSHLDAESPDCEASAALPHSLPLHEEDPLPQAPVRVHAEEALAECDEAGDVEDPVGGEMVNLYPVRVQEATEKIMDREG